MKHFLTFIALLTTSLAFGQESCPNMHDSNSNGTIDIEDFLSVLGLFGDVDADADGLWDSQDGCTDLESCNFMDVSAEFCTYPDAIGDCNGSCPADVNGDGICDVYSCGTPVGYQGYDYATVLIGDKCWFKENLRVEQYRNGDGIASELSDSEWHNSTVGAFAIPGECDNLSNYQNLTENKAIYGLLYNYYAISDSRGLCPSNWHVSGDGEWLEMIELFGGQAIAGIHLKSDTLWQDQPNGDSGNGDNFSGFSGLPASERTSQGSCGPPGNFGRWWTSDYWEASNGITYAWHKGLTYTYDGVNSTNTSYLTHGRSVRCVRDAE